MCGEYNREKEKLCRGFGTWDTRSVTTHVRLPQGFAVNIAFKEYLYGQYLQEPLIGRRGNQAEVVLAGPHAYDGSYTELTILWKKLRFGVRTAQLEGNLVLCVQVLENPTRFTPLCVLEGMTLWNRSGYASREGEKLIWQNDNGEKMELYLVRGTVQEDPYCRCRTAYLPVSLESPVYAATGKRYSPEEIEAALQEGKEGHAARKNSYGAHGDAWEAMQTCLAWDEVYDPLGDRLVSNVSRIWNVQRGGYGMFCWDNFFASMMIALDDPARGRMNAVEILNEAVEEGFVPNCSNAYGRKSFDRSQPPVGSFVCREIYRREPQRWFLEEVYPKLLRWNEWWLKERLEGGLLCWGSNAYDNRWEMSALHDTSGAALESGMDNSPMYDDISFDEQGNKMRLWDVGLNGLYAMDCACLVDIARTLGDAEGERKLRKRYESIRVAMARLWDEQSGVYRNAHTPSGTFASRLSPTCFYAALGSIPSPEQYVRMVREHLLNPAEFWGKWVLPSISRDDPAYADNNYWRGRIWAPLNFLVYVGMTRYAEVDGARAALARKSEELLLNEWSRHRHVHENYNADTGEGDDVPNSDAFYQWGGLLAYIALAESGKVAGFGEEIAQGK